MKKFKLLETQFHEGVGIHTFEVLDKDGKVKPYLMVRFSTKGTIFYQFFVSRQNFIKKVQIALKLSKFA